MDIWTEHLQRRHLPLMEQWVGRTDGAVTPNDLPQDAGALTVWFEACAEEPGRQDFLITVYETPVGVAGFRRGGQGTAELYLLLGEVQYNLLRTATYAVQRVLDHAFQNAGLDRVTVRVYRRCAKLLDALERMGFTRDAQQDDGMVFLAIEKNAFRRRKYLF